jgi:hypothetical protein
MAYAALDKLGLIRRNRSKSAIIHRRAVLTVGGAAGAGYGGGATTAASLQMTTPPGRLIAIKYGAPDATTNEPIGALTGGALVIKADTTGGAQIWTDGDLSSQTDVPLPVGTTAVDEGGAATAATDGFNGGFPVRAGVFLSITGGTDTEVLYVDMWFRLCTFAQVVLVSQSGADATGVVTQRLDIGHAGVLAAIAIDYQNTPAGADLLIKADNTNGYTIFTRTSSQTDLAPSLLGRPGADEAINASAATDGTECGNVFRRGLFFDVAENDIFTSGNEKIIVECWIDD